MIGETGVLLELGILAAFAPVIGLQVRMRPPLVSARSLPDKVRFGVFQRVQV